MISAETLSIYAKKNNINFYDHVAHLIVHSLLHVNGYQHNNELDYKVMSKKEIKILNKIGISTPY